MLGRDLLIHFPFEIQYFCLLGDLQKRQKPLSPLAEKNSGFQYFIEIFKSLKMPIFVIPANPGSSPGQAPESSDIKVL